MSDELQQFYTTYFYIDERMLYFKYVVEIHEHIVITLFSMCKYFLTIKLIIMPRVYLHILT